AAIAHLETLRAHGADYFLLPVTSLWWLDHYAEFGRHLRSRYRVLIENEGVTLFSLREPAEHRSAHEEIRRVVAEARRRLGREPAVLDWHTELELSSALPAHAVFAPPEDTNGRLPY